MDSSIKALAFISFAFLLASCSSLPTHQLDRTAKTVDFVGLREKAQLVSARTADLKKYKVCEVSF